MMDSEPCQPDHRQPTLNIFAIDMQETKKEGENLAKIEEQVSEEEQELPDLW